MHIHILGICGTFMGGLAVLARAAGHRVTGCDAGVYPPMSTQLEAQDIALIEGWDPSQCDLKPDLFVVGNVVTRGNPLMEAILDDGLPYVSAGRSGWPSMCSRAGHVLAVAGTHGKTTTTVDAGVDPRTHGGLATLASSMGGVPRNFGVSARLGKTAGAGGARAPFVIEADEYDTAFFDKRSQVRPLPATRTAVLNNLEFDHADIFPDLAAIETQFHHLVRTMPVAAACIVVNGAQTRRWQRVLERGCVDAEVAALRRAQGASPAHWSTRAGRCRIRRALRHAARSSMKIARVEWPLLGEHNRDERARRDRRPREHLGVAIGRRPRRRSASFGERRSAGSN